MFATTALFLSLAGLLQEMTLPIGNPVRRPETVQHFAQTDADVDVELVLAVDTSGSMDIEEMRVQRAGYLAALRHPDFINAVSAGYQRRIAIAYFEWAGTVNESSTIGWQVIETAADAEAFAAMLEDHPVASRRGTSISRAIDYARSLIETNAYRGERRVIDVSGDGANNAGPPVVPARDAAVGGDIIVNGLAILIRPSGVVAALDDYYRDCVIGGPGSFVLPVRKPEDFATAIRQKLVLEIGGYPARPAIMPVQMRGATDCMIGEKTRPMYFNDR